MLASGRSPFDACCRAAGVWRRAAGLARAEGQPVAKIAFDLGISESCLRRWIAVDDVHAGRQEQVELRRQNRVEAMEVEVLKRASAYFARQNVLPRG